MQHNKNSENEYRHIFIDLNILNNKRLHKKLEKLNCNQSIETHIFHEFGEYLVNEKMYDVTNIPINSYKTTLQYNNKTIHGGVNVYNQTQYAKKEIAQIPLEHKTVFIQKNEYTINDKSKVLFIIEKHIIFEENMHDYELLFDDESNIHYTNFYFMINKDVETSYFIKEDLFSLVSILN